MTTLGRSEECASNPASDSSHIKPLALGSLAFILANAWALNYICAKIMGLLDVPLFASLVTVHLTMIAVFGGILIYRKKLISLSLSRIVFFVYAGGIGNVLSLSAELASAEHIPAGLLAIIISTAPVFTLIISFVLRTEVATFRSILGVLMGLGAALTILWTEVQSNDGDLTWTLVAFIAPASFGAMAVIMWAAWPQGLDALQVSFGNAIAGLFLIVPFAWVEGGSFDFSGPKALGGLALAGFIVTLTAENWLFALVTRNGGAIYASCADFAAIAMGLFWAYVFFGESPTIWMTVAGFFAIGSLYFVAKRGA